MRYAMFVSFFVVCLLVPSAQAQPAGEWTGTFGIPGVAGPVYALAESGDRLYVGGDFFFAGDESASGLGIYDFAEGAWIPISGLGGYIGVHALAIGPDGALYVGGQFDTAGGEPAANIARYDLTTEEWTSLGEGISGFAVYALAFGPDGSLYTGGRFEAAGGVAARNTARWDGEVWSGVGDVGEDSGDSVTGLVFDESVLYVGGRFSTAGGVETENVARYDLTTGTWSGLGGGVVRSNSAGVEAIAVGADGVFVGGTFDEARQPDGSALAVNNVARWDPAAEAWSALGDGIEEGLYVLAFGPEGTLYAAGEREVGGLETESHLARWDGTAWEPVDLGAAAQLASHQLVGSALLAANGRLYVGFRGYFLFEGGNPNDFLYDYDPASGAWAVLGGPATDGLNENVFDLATDADGSGYAAGLFRFAGTERVDYVARWDAEAEAWTALGGGADWPVGDLLLHSGGDLYVGGGFSEVYQPDGAALAAEGVARWDGTQWASLGGGIRSGVGRNLAEAADGTLYVGGSFREVYQTDGAALAADGVAQWDPVVEAWQAVPGGHGLDRIYVLAFDAAGALYAGGERFVEGESRARIARLDPSTEQWEALREWGFTFGVRDLVAVGDPAADGALYAAVYTEGVWRWHSGVWTGLDGPDVAFSLARNGDPAAGGVLYAGGVNDGISSGPYVQQWDGSSWSGLGSGLIGFVSPPIVSALAVGPGMVEGEVALWVGGEFVGAGGEPASCVARWETENLGTAAEDGMALESLGLEAYPNPSSGSVAVRYTLAAPGPVRLAVYDVLGREVAVLADAVQPVGEHAVQLGGSDLAAGVYLVRLEVGGETLTRRLTLVR